MTQLNEQKKVLGFHLHGNKMRNCTVPDHVSMNFLGWGGLRGVQNDDILSMHLESHIGLFSAPLYDFNGKAL